MKHLLTTLAAVATLVAGCAQPHEDVLYHVATDVPAAHYDAILECAAEYQPMVPYTISVQRGGLVDERVSQHTRIVQVDYLDTVISNGSRVLGAYSTYHDALEVTDDEAWLVRQAAKRDEDSAWMIKRVTCHEMGHSLGLRHDDCGADSLIAPLNKHSVNAPGECEASVLATL